jgi:hypothetical protein
MKLQLTAIIPFLVSTLALAADEPKGMAPPRHPVLQNPGSGVDLVERVLNSAPPDMLRKLAAPETLAEGQKEITQYFGQTVINQPAKLRVKVEYAGAYSQGPNKFRIRALSAPVKWPGGEMGRLVWLYFNADKIPPADKVKVGSEVVISGIVRRCEVTNRTGFLKINFDLTGCAVEPR